jgi:hypothetical protein
MPWWLVPSIILVVIAGAGAGLLIGRFILKRQNKSFPEFERQQNSVLLTETKSASPPKQVTATKPRLITKKELRREKTPQTQAQSITLAEDTLEKYISKSQSAQLNVDSVIPEKTSPITQPPVVPERVHQPNMSQVVPDNSLQSSRLSAVPEKITQPPKPFTVPSQSAAVIELESNLAIAKLPVVEKLDNFNTDIWNTRRSEFNLTDSQLLSELTEAYVDMLLANNIVWLIMELGRDSKDLRESYSDLKSKVAERLERVLPRVKEALK